MKCERCGCEIEGMIWKVDSYDTGISTNTHLMQQDCIDSLRRQLDALQPKPERFAASRDYLKFADSVYENNPLLKEHRDLLQAYDEAVEIINKHNNALYISDDFANWLQKWGNK